MGLIMDLLDDLVLGPLNLINRAEGIWRLAAARDRGVRFSLLRLDKGGKHTRKEARSLLARYGVATFGTTHDSKCLHFLVKSRQAVWAEYLLLHAGIELQNPLVDPRNAQYANSHARGWMPKPWSESDSESSGTNLNSSGNDVGTGASLESQVDRALERIAQW